MSISVAFIHSMSAHCGARLSSLSRRTVHWELERVREVLGLDPYQEKTGMIVGDVHFE